MVAVAVLVGYLLALGGTSVGQGWRLLGHLAHAHAPAVPAAPEVYTEASAAARPALTTLCPRPHRHAEAEPHSHGAPPVLPRFVRARTEAHSGFHEHGGFFHTHEAPAPEPPVVLTIALDKHRLPTALALPRPPRLRDAAFGDSDDALRPPSLPVETPPPRAHG